MRVKWAFFIVIMLSVIVGLSGVASSEAKVSDTQVKGRIYDAFFKDLAMAGFVMDSSRQMKAYVPEDAMKTISQEMKQITNIREYSSNAAIGGVFKKGYRLMYIYTKQTIKENYRFQGLLYSKDNASMIIRKYDIIPTTIDNLPKIAVYEFTIPKKVNDILQKCQSQLPKDAPFCYSWKQFPGNRIQEH